MSEIQSLRESLAKVNTQLFNILKMRKEASQNIQEIKKSNSIESSYDKEQEIRVFSDFKEDLCALSLRELLAYSLIVECHASGERGHYPSWSKGEHLVDFNNETQEMINPNLLAVTNKTIYDSLNFKSQYK